MKNKIIEINFYELIKIAVSGVWIIAFFAILGILISFIYVNNSKDERKFGITIPLADLNRNDMGVIHEINDNLKNLFEHTYEKNLTIYPETRITNKNTMLSPINEMIVTNFEVAKNAGTYKNILTSNNIQSMILDSVKNVKIIKEVMLNYNKHIKENFGENDFRIISKADHDSRYEPGIGILNTVYFDQPYDKDIANIYSFIFINLVHKDVNRKINISYERAQERYFYEIEYLRTNTQTIVDSLTGEYKLYLNNAVEKIKFQRELAIELKYSLPQINIPTSLDTFSFLNGYRYLNKVLEELESKIKEDFTKVIPELRFFSETLKGLDKNVTLNRVEKRMKKIGLHDNNLTLFSIHKDGAGILAGVSKIRLFENSNAFLIYYGGIFGTLIGILLSFIFYFIRDKKKSS